MKNYTSGRRIGARRASLLAASCLAMPLAPPPPRPLTAMLDGAGRDNAAAKDSSWAASRLELEASKPRDVHEMLLVDPTTGDVLEGASSNVFAVVGGEVYTAVGSGVRGQGLGVRGQLSQGPRHSTPPHT